jgi:hypothetical protein
LAQEIERDIVEHLAAVKKLRQAHRELTKPAPKRRGRPPGRRPD